MSTKRGRQLRLRRLEACAFLRGVWDYLDADVQSVVAEMEIAGTGSLSLKPSAARDRIRAAEADGRLGDDWARLSAATNGGSYWARAAFLVSAPGHGRGDTPALASAKLFTQKALDLATRSRTAYNALADSVANCLRPNADLPRPCSGGRPGLAEIDGVLASMVMDVMRDASDGTSRLAAADRLEEEGLFTEAGLGTALVAHLRDPGPHYRGCWVIDCLLGLR